MNDADRVCPWCGKPVNELNAQGRSRNIHKRCAELKRQVRKDLALQQHFENKYKNENGSAIGRTIKLKK